jgi:methionine-rich copper-binding protein CopC
MNPLKLALLSTAVLVLVNLALGHSEIKSSVPKDHAHLMTAPKTVVIEFDEALETSVSRFRVYRYELASMMKGNKPMTGAQMDDFAEAAAKTILSRKSDTADRMDTGLVATKRQSSKVTIGLKSALKPGIYVVAWRATSVDTHVETGFLHFHLEGHSMPGMK